MTKLEKVAFMLSQPKLQTSHYNLNGLNLYTSKFTILLFSCVVLAFVVMQVLLFVPVMACWVNAGLFVSTEYITAPLSNMVDIGYN